MVKNKSLTQILALIGAILILIDGVLTFFQFGYGIGFLPFWINGLILIFVGLCVLFSIDVIQGLKIPYNGIWLLILGIAGLIFGGWYIGGILVIIAAILWFLGKK